MTTKRRPRTGMLRGEVAKVLGTSIASVRRLEERGILNPTRDRRGQHLHSIAEVEALRATRMPAGDATLPSAEVSAGNQVEVAPRASSESTNAATAASTASTLAIAPTATDSSPASVLATLAELRSELEAVKASISTAVSAATLWATPLWRHEESANRLDAIERALLACGMLVRTPNANR